MCACVCVLGEVASGGVQREGPATHPKGSGLLAIDSKKSGPTRLFQIPAL